MNIFGKEIKFYNNTFSVANPAENKLHSQDIQIPWNQDLNYNNALLDIVS